MESATTTKRIAFVQACWHREIVDQGREAFVAEIGRHGVSSDQIDFYAVPGVSGDLKLYQYRRFENG